MGSGSSSSWVVSSLPLTIGDGYAGGYDGLIDEVSVYQKALSPDEISKVFSHYNPGKVSVESPDMPVRALPEVPQAAA